jgi:trans-aconitate methyltransferase
MGYMEIMDPTGHTKQIWSADKEAEVEAARAVFDNLTAAGYRAFHVKKDGEEGRRMETFDPAAEKMILLPQLRGG